MPGTPVAIGPFSGGLNNYSDISAVGDNEATVLENFDVDLDGTLVSRGAIYKRNDLGSSGWHEILGMYTIGGVTYIISTTETNTRWFNTKDSTMGTVVSYPTKAMVVYDNKVWLVTSGAAIGNGGSWSPSAGWVAAVDMPSGTTAVMYKERMFIGGTGGRVRFSSPADLTSWATSDFFDVRSGDGDPLVKLIVFNNQIVIFKNESTYIFAYDASPSRGNVEVISGSVGVDNDKCVIEQDGIIYIYHNQIIYAINNWKWERINIKVNLDASVDDMPTNYTSQYTLSILGDRLVVRHNKDFYMFGLKTRVWTKWTTSHFPDYWVQHPERRPDGSDLYFATAYNKDISGRLYAYEENKVNTLSDETFVASVVSKMYDYTVPYNFKRLSWWGVDLNTKTPIDVVAIAFVYDSPINLSVTDSITQEYVTGARVFVKFIKALRFRKIRFKLESTLDGTASTGPLRIYSMVGVISNKQLVPKKIN